LWDTVSNKENGGREVNTRKEAADKFKVSERKVRTVQEIEKKAPEVCELLLAEASELPYVTTGDTDPTSSF